MHPGESGKNGEKSSHYMIIIPYVKNKFKNEKKKKRCYMMEPLIQPMCMKSYVTPKQKVLFHFKTNDMTMKMKR